MPSTCLLKWLRERIFLFIRGKDCTKRKRNIIFVALMKTNLFVFGGGPGSHPTHTLLQWRKLLIKEKGGRRGGKKKKIKPRQSKGEGDGGVWVLFCLSLSPPPTHTYTHSSLSLNSPKATKALAFFRLLLLCFLCNCLCLLLLLPLLSTCKWERNHTLNFLLLFDTLLFYFFFLPFFSSLSF